MRILGIARIEKRIEAWWTGLETRAGADYAEAWSELR